MCMWLFYSVLFTQDQTVASRNNTFKTQQSKVCLVIWDVYLLDEFNSKFLLCSNKLQGFKTNCCKI